MDNQLHEDMKKIVEVGDTLMDKIPANNFARIFWQQQVKAAKIQDPRGMRWHPLMLKWCIYLRHQSQSAYETNMS